MKKLPYIHRRAREWGSTDVSVTIAKSRREAISNNPVNHLLKVSRERRLTHLNNSLSPVGNLAKLDFIDAYKNLSILTQKNRLEKLDDSPSVAYLENLDKFNLNPEPFGIVRRHGPDNSIDIHSYSMGDVYANCFSEGINQYKDVKELDLTNNRLSENGCTKIVQKLKLKNILKIVLAENKIGHSTILGIIDIIDYNHSKLKWLDIESTQVSDKSISSLCKSLCSNKVLRHLNIAKNNLGYISAIALSNMLKENNVLKRLDLHWNNFRSVGAHEFCQGLAVNASLLELDLSWNSLGRDSSLDVAKALGNALKSNKELMHLDIGYNYFSKAECEVISEMIKDNHTILGLHALGNDCGIDSKGFVLPNEYTGKVQQSHFFSRIFHRKANRVKRNDKGNCWICDKWIEVTFRWVPGTSGEASMPPIYLHLESDNYAKELMIKQKDGSFSLTRVIPPHKLKFFFSNRSGVMKSNEFKSQNLLQPITIENLPQVNYVNIHHFEGLICKIKEPFKSKARLLGDSFQAAATEYEKIPWNIPISIFKDYRADSQDFLLDCFDFDWKASKLMNFAKVPEIQEKIKELLISFYPLIIEAYRTLSAYSGNELFCITQNVLIDFLNQAHIIDNIFQVSDLGVNWNAANAGKEKGEIYNAGNGLCRYEFMEIIVRIANDRYVRHKVAKNPAEALEKLIDEHLKELLPSYDNRVFRQEKYMIEEIDYFIKAHKVVFEALFKKYSGRKAVPGQKPFMSLDEFRMLCVDTGMISESFTTREIDVCYSQAMMTQIDYLYKKRHLEMNYVEFLEAICRAASQTSIEDNPEATLRDKLVALVPNLLSVCPTSVSDVFVKPTEETYFRMMYRPKVY